MNLSKSGTSSHFVITAVVVNEADRVEVEQQAELLRRKHFQGGEMRSSKVGINSSRRLRILSDLAHIPFRAYIFVVNKARLTSEGFLFRDTFYKYLYGRAYKRLASEFPHLQIAADELRDSEFMAGFRRYVQREHLPRSLFQQSGFDFVDSKQSVLVQVADMIGGSVARRFDSMFVSEGIEDYLQPIRYRVSAIEEWPEEYLPYSYTPDPGRFGIHDQSIAEYAVRQATEFVNDHMDSSEPRIRDQVVCLNILLMTFRFIAADRYVSTLELLRNLQANESRPIKVHQFRSKVIAKLRDAGVIIVSSSRGYKLPSSAEELFVFVNHANINVRPQIERVKRCRNRIYSITQGQLDILDRPEYAYFRAANK